MVYAGGSEGKKHEASSPAGGALGPLDRCDGVRSCPLWRLIQKKGSRRRLQAERSKNETDCYFRSGRGRGAGGAVRREYPAGTPRRSRERQQRKTSVKEDPVADIRVHRHRNAGERGLRHDGREGGE